MTPELEPARDAPSSRAPRRARTLLIRRVTGFAFAFVLVMVLAFNDGGFDIVPRQQAAMVVWILIAVGLAFGLLPRARPPRVVAIPMLGIAGLALFSLLALSWTETDERTFAEAARVIGYAGYMTLAYLSLNRHTWTGAASGLAAAALLVPVFSLISRLVPDLVTDDTVSAFATDRLSYPLGYWNALACWAAMATAIGLVWSGQARRIEVRSLALAAVPVAGAVTYLTYSRAGVIATAVAVLVAIWLSDNRWTVALHALATAVGAGLVIVVIRGQPEIVRASGDDGAAVVGLAAMAAMAGCAAAAWASSRSRIDQYRLPRQTSQIAVPVGALLAVVLMIAVGGSRLNEAWDEFKNDEVTVESSVDPTTRLTSFGGSRHTTYAEALDAFESDSARGIGPGSFEFWWAREAENPIFLRDAHSLYLETLAELGVIGFLALLTLLGGALLVAMRARRPALRRGEQGANLALIAAFLVFLVFAGVDWIWEFPAIVVIALGGIAVAGAAASPRWGGKELPALARAGAVAAALVFALVQVPGLVSTERLRASAAELRDGELVEAAELADDAVRAQPWAASPYAHRALVAEADGMLDGAAEDLREAIDREPTNWRHRVLAARVAARQGDAAAARQQLAAAERLAPTNDYLLPGGPFLREIQILLGANPERP